jgi:hypothetical protein
MAGKTPAADAALPAPETPAAAPWGRWRYDGPPGRAYVNVPVTPQPGDVITWPDPPATDGSWTATEQDATCRPDNHRPDPAGTVKEG